MTELSATDEARAEILRRIRASGADLMAELTVQRDYERSLSTDTDPVELFAERVADYKAVVRRVGATELATQVGLSLSERGAARIAVPAGVDTGWLSAADVERVSDEPKLSHQQLDLLDGVITGCAVAIAETGTIVLDGGPGQGRRALSLLPDYHLCVVLQEQIVGTVPEAIERLDPRRPQTWISGPSATSDIELQRVEGVHGPRNLEVLIVSR